MHNVIPVGELADATFSVDTPSGREALEFRPSTSCNKPKTP